MKLPLLAWLIVGLSQSVFGAGDAPEGVERINNFLKREKTPDENPKVPNDIPVIPNEAEDFPSGDPLTRSEDDESEDMSESNMEMDKRGGSVKVWMKNAKTGWSWKRVERVVPTRGEISSTAGKLNGGLIYISGSRTYDNVRQNGGGPYNTWFRDRFNTEWYVRINKNGYGVTFMVPCGSDIWFYGNNNRVRTGSSAHTSWAELNFTYLSGGWGQNNGIRLRLQGYRYGNSKEDNSDKALVDDIFNYVGQGVDIANKVSLIVARHSKKG